MRRVWYAVLSAHCSLVVTFWEKANRLALLCVVFSCVFATFQCGVLGQVCYLILSIPNICLLTDFVISNNKCILFSDSLSVPKAMGHTSSKNPQIQKPLENVTSLLLLLSYCLMYFPVFVGDLRLFLFCYAFLCVHSSFAINLKRKRKLVALLLLSYRCIVTTIGGKV